MYGNLCPEEKLSVEVDSYIRGIHVYNRNCGRKLEIPYSYERESDNCIDKFAVAVCKRGKVKGHVPRHLSRLFSTFLQRDSSKGMAEVTGERVNRGAGYGVNVPCKFSLFGKKVYVECLQLLCDTTMNPQ